MPPITRSNKMGDIHEEEERKGAGSSNPKPEGDLVSLMARMMKEFKQEVMTQMDVWARESEARMLAAQNTLFEEFKGRVGVRPPTPMGNVVPNEVPEEDVDEEVYEGWQGGYVRDRVNNLENGRFEEVMEPIGGLEEEMGDMVVLG